MDPTAKELTAISIVLFTTLCIVFIMAFVILIVIGMRNARKANANPDREYVVMQIVDQNQIILKEKSSGYQLTMKVENAYDEAFVVGTVIIMPKTVQPFSNNKNQ